MGQRGSSESQTRLIHSLEDDLAESQLLAQQSQPRIALVIGNANYGTDRLDNPVNDATDVAEALEDLGFEVTLLLNRNLRDMENALEDFSQQLREGSVGAFYYAGHGVQVEGENYLIPLNAKLERQNDVRYDALPLGKVLNVMEESESTVNIVIVDACRNNPFLRRWRSRDRTLSSSRGLAVEIPPEGTVISFATAPDDVASDGEGRNSPYTASLLQHIDTEGADIVDVIRLVRADVWQETEGRQLPWHQESIIGSFSLNPSSNNEASPVVASSSVATSSVDRQSLPTTATQTQADLLALINDEREEQGLPSLRFSTILTNAAQDHVMYIADNNYKLSHTGEGGSSTRDRVEEAGYASRFATQIIDAGYDSPQGIFDEFMSFGNYKEAILNPNYSEVGIGYVINHPDAYYDHYWVVVLGNPSLRVAE